MKLPGGPLTRGRLKTFKEAIQGLRVNVPILMKSRLEELGVKRDLVEVHNNVIQILTEPATKTAHQDRIPGPHIIIRPQYKPSKARQIETAQRYNEAAYCDRFTSCDRLISCVR